MHEPWEMRLVVDAHDQDLIRVRPQRFGTGPQVHLAVRTGPLLVYCLDSAAVRTIAAAWAQAQASSAHTLPATSAPPAHKPKGADQRGKAYPVADVVAEGPQRWDVAAPHPGQPFTVVTTDWLTVRVHDRAALQTYTHAWASACALGIQCLPKAPANFDRLLRDAYDRDFLHRYHQEHPNERPNRGR